MLKTREDAEYAFKKHSCAAVLRVCRDFLDLTDPRPLTVERLPDLGGVQNPKSEMSYRFGNDLTVYADGPPEEWEWVTIRGPVRDLSPWLNPLTEGHLRWLLLMMEER